MNFNTDAISQEMAFRIKKELSFLANGSDIAGVILPGIGENPKYITTEEELERLQKLGNKQVMSALEVSERIFQYFLEKNGTSESSLKEHSRVKQMHEIMNGLMKKMKEKIDEFLQQSREMIDPEPVICEFCEDYFNGVYNESVQFSKQIQAVFRMVGAKISSKKLDEEKKMEEIAQSAKLFEEEINDRFNKHFKLFGIPELPKSPKVREIKRVNSIFDHKTGICGRGVKGHPTKPQFICYSDKGSLKLFEESNDIPVCCGEVNIGGLGEGYNPVAWSTDGNLIAAGGRCNKIAYVLAQIEKELTIVCQIPTTTSNNYMWQIEWVSPSFFICGYNHGDLKLLDSANTKVLKEVTHHVAGGIESMCFMGDGLCIGDTKGRLYEVSIGNLVKTWTLENLHNDRICMVTANTQKSLIATCGNDFYVNMVSRKSLSIVWKTKLSNKLWNLVKTHLKMIKSQKILL